MFFEKEKSVFLRPETLRGRAVVARRAHNPEVAVVRILPPLLNQSAEIHIKGLSTFFVLLVIADGAFISLLFPNRPLFGDNDVIKPLEVGVGNLFGRPAGIRVPRRK